MLGASVTILKSATITIAKVLVSSSNIPGEIALMTLYFSESSSSKKEK